MAGGGFQERRLRHDGRGQEGRLPRGRDRRLRQEALPPPDARDFPPVRPRPERPRGLPAGQVVRRRNAGRGEHRRTPGGRARPRVRGVFADARRPEEGTYPRNPDRLHGRHRGKPPPARALRIPAVCRRTRHGHGRNGTGRGIVDIRQDCDGRGGAQGVLQGMGRERPRGTGDEAEPSRGERHCRRGVPGTLGEPALVHPLLDDRQRRQAGQGSTIRRHDREVAAGSRRGRAYSREGGSRGVAHALARGRRRSGKSRQGRKEDQRVFVRYRHEAATCGCRTVHGGAPRDPERRQGGEVEGRGGRRDVGSRRGVGVQRVRVGVRGKRGRGGHQPRGVRLDGRRDRTHQREDRTALRARPRIVALAGADQVAHVRGDGTGDQDRRRGGLQEVAREPRLERIHRGREGHAHRGRCRRTAPADGDRARQGVRQALRRAAGERTGHACERGKGALGQLCGDTSERLRNVHRHGGRHGAVVARIRRDDHRQHDAPPAHPQRHDAPREPPRRIDFDDDDGPDDAGASGRDRLRRRTR